MRNQNKAIRDIIYEDIMITLAFGTKKEKDLHKIVKSTVYSIIYKHLIDENVDIYVENVNNREKRFVLEINIPKYYLNFSVVMNRLNNRVKLDGITKFFDWYDRNNYPRGEYRYHDKEIFGEDKDQ